MYCVLPLRVPISEAPGGGPNNRSCCWLGGWVRNWIIKLDHIIGPEIGRSNFLKWTIQFPIQFSDPIFKRISLQSRARKNWIKKLDQEIGSSYLVPHLLQFVDPILRSNFTIQFFVAGQPGGWLGRQLTVFDHLATAAHSWPSRRLPLVSGGPQIRCIRFFLVTFSVSGSR